MIPFLFTSYEGDFEGMAHHRVRLGSFAVAGDRWHLRCWSPGVTFGGSVLRAGFDLSTGRPGSTRMEVHSLDGRYRGTVVLLARRQRVERRLAEARAAAGRTQERQARVRQGEWWLDPRAFSDLGPAEAVSVPESRYLGGWDGAVRFEGRRGARILDFDRAGVTLRGMRRHLLIPWDRVRAVTVEGEGGPATVRVTTDQGEVGFGADWSSAEDLRVRLEPLTRRIGRAAAGGHGSAGGQPGPRPADRGEGADGT